MTGVIVRRRAAAMTALLAMILAAMALAGASPGYAQGNPPSVECASDLWNGEYWKIQINDGAAGEIETNVGSSTVAFVLSGGSMTLTNQNDDSIFRVVLKTGGGTNDATLTGTWPTGASIAFALPDKLSHITVCFTTPQAATTTSMASTTTTNPGTTTSMVSTTTTNPGTTTPGTDTTKGPTTTVIDDSSTTLGVTTTSENVETSTTASPETSVAGVTTQPEGSSTTSQQPATSIAPAASSTSSTAGVASEATSSTMPTQDDPTTSVAGLSTTTVPEVTADSLPFTGSDTAPLMMVGVLAVTAGAGLVLGSRRRGSVAQETDLGSWSQD